MSIENQTPERTAPVPYVFLSPIWRDSSPVCSMPASSNSTGDTLLMKLSTGDDSKDAPYCGGGLNALEFKPVYDRDERIDEGGSYVVDPSLNTIDSQSVQIREDAASSLVRALTNPDGWILFGESRADDPKKLRNKEMYNPREFWRSPGL